MAFLQIQNVTITGISAAVPKEIKNNMGTDCGNIPKYDNEDFVATTGIKQRRCNPKLPTSELFYVAAEKLISDLKWEKKDIDAIIVVTQSGDYILPATSCILQDRIGIPKTSFCLDINLGCSGWVYGLATLSSIMQTGTIKKGLLFAGDNGYFHPDDDMLFGSAGTVTALSFDESSTPMLFNTGTDGSGYDTIIIPDGAAKNQVCYKSFDKFEIDGHIYNSLQDQINGLDVFSFGITTVPKSIKSLLSHFDIDPDSIDYLVLHQANLKMNNMIVKKLKIPKDKSPICLDEFGNTSSASIPLTMVTRMAEPLKSSRIKILSCGFGVGLSWGATFFETDNIVVSKLIEI